MPLKNCGNAGFFTTPKEKTQQIEKEIIISSEINKKSAYTKKIANKLRGGRQRARSDRRGPRGDGRSEAENGAGAKRPRPKPRGTRRGGPDGPRKGTGGRRASGFPRRLGAKRRADGEIPTPEERERGHRVAPCLPSKGLAEAQKG